MTTSGRQWAPVFMGLLSLRAQGALKSGTDVETEALRGEGTSLWPHSLGQEGRGSTWSWGPSLVIPQLLSKVDCHPAHVGTWYIQQAPPLCPGHPQGPGDPNHPQAGGEGSVGRDWATGLVLVVRAKTREHQSRQPLFEKTGRGRRLRPCTRDPDMGQKAESPHAGLC